MTHPGLRLTEWARKQAASAAIRSDIESDTRALSGKAADLEAILPSDEEHSSESDDSWSDSDVDLSYDASHSRDEECTGGRARSRWSKEEEMRLLVCKRDNWPWKQIFREFPRRTLGAVQTRWHMLKDRA